MRRILLVLSLAGWAAACTPERVPASVPAPTPSNPASPASTIVPELQRAAERSLAATRHAGALVALNPQDGKLLALYSISGRRGDPLVTLHQPGSTFKVFSAIAALEAGVIDADTTLTCNRSYAFGELTLTCPLAHGPENAAKALAVSCNAFFYALADKQGPEPLRSVAAAFGFGEPTGIELDAPAGVLRDPAPDPERPSLDLMDAIGHGAYRTNLLELARAYAAIANGGMLVTLHRNSETAPAARRLPYAETTLALVRGALFDAVDKDYGRTHAQRIDGYPFAGKTGGVDAPGRDDSTNDVVMDSWFVAFAPPTNPKLLVAARLERVPQGGPLTAAAVVREVLLEARELAQR